jgi:hypothetical protein
MKRYVVLMMAIVLLSVTVAGCWVPSGGHSGRAVEKRVDRHHDGGHRR